MCLLIATSVILTFTLLFSPARSQINGNNSFDWTLYNPNTSLTSDNSQPSPEDDVFQPETLPEDGGPDCKCVEYYLCSSDGKLITNGEGGLFDARILPERRCPGVQVCCEFREVGMSPATEPLSPEIIEPVPPEKTEPVPPEKTEPVPPETGERLPRETKDPLSAGSCGVRGGNANPTRLRKRDVSYGIDTEFGEFPWMLALLRGEETREGSWKYNLIYCGASLIYPQVALTAAHCISSRFIAKFIVRAGEWDPQTEVEPLPHHDREVVNIIKHPQYYSGVFYNDIALLILDSPLPMALNVLPICLPEQNAVFDGRRCLATEWGVSSFGQSVKDQQPLQKVVHPIIPSSECQKKIEQLGVNLRVHLNDSFICAGGEGGRGIGQGGSGGPLVCQLPETSTYVQAGILIWGIRYDLGKVPDVYTNVAQYRNWIDSTLKNITL